MLWVLDMEQNYLLLCAIQKWGLHTFIVLLCVHGLLNYFCFSPTRSGKKSIKIIPLGNFFFSFWFQFKLNENFQQYIFDTELSLVFKVRIIVFFFWLRLNHFFTTFIKHWSLIFMWGLQSLGPRYIFGSFKKQMYLSFPLAHSCVRIWSCYAGEVTTISLVLYWNQSPDLVSLETFIVLLLIIF